MRRTQRRRLRLELTKHQNECGLMIASRFSPLRGYTPHWGWAPVAVTVDGDLRTVITQLSRDLTWIP